MLGEAALDTLAHCVPHDAPNSVYVALLEAEPWLTAKRRTDLDMAADGRIRPDRPWRRAISALTVPTLVISGTGEVIWDSQEWAALQSCGNPLVETAVVDGADHCVRRTQPERFHAVVDPWLGRHLMP